MADRVAAFLKARPHGTAPVVVGALPFDKRRPAYLFQPELLQRFAGRVSPSSLGVLPPGSDSPAIVAVIPEPSPDRYGAAVDAVLPRLGGSATNRIGKIVLARTLVVRTDSEILPERLVAILNEDSGATAYQVSLPGGSWLVGATPELLLAKRGASVVSHPLAGSARRIEGGDDRAAGAALLASDKDRHEHAAVVEWVADHLAPWCSDLQVPSGPEVVGTASMLHLGTRITGTLRDSDVPSLMLTSILHPTPAVCGTPLEPASAMLDELEPFDRGYFTGAVGWTDISGDGDWYLSIRCAEVCGTSARLYAGAGVVAGSSAAGEIAETEAKFAAMLHAFGITREAASL